MKIGARPRVSESWLGRGTLLAVGIIWALLVAAGLAGALWRMIPRLPTIFAGEKARSFLESGDEDLHEFLSASGACWRGEPEIIALSNDANSFLFVSYRLAYKLYPVRVRCSYAGFLPPVGGRFSINVGASVKEMIGRRNLDTALFYVRDRPELRGCFKISLSGDERVDFAKVERQEEAGTSSAGAKRWFLWPVGLASLVFFGFAAMRATRLDRSFAGSRAAKLALCLLAGSGLMEWFQVLLAIGGVRWSLPVLIAPWAFLGAWIFFAGKRGRDGEGGYGAPSPPASAVDWTGKALVAVAVSIALLETAMPMSAWSNWDTWAIWEMKTRAFWEVLGLPFAFLRDELYAFSHHEYPPGLPAVQCYLALFSGGLDERLFRLLSPFFGLALAVLTADLAGGLGLRRTRWLLAGMVLCGSRFLDQAGNGYADLPVACGMVACLAVLARVYRGEAPPWSVGFFGGALGLLKAEGLVWAGGCLAVLGVWTVMKRVRVREFAAAALVFVALSAPWKGVSTHLKLKPLDYKFDIASMVRNLPVQGPVVIKAMVLNTLGPGATMKNMAGGVTEASQWWNQFRGGWPLLWYFTLACVVFGQRSLRASPLREMGAVLIIQMCAYGAVYLVSLRNVEWHIVTSLDRLLLQVAPCALVLGAGAAARLVEGEREEPAPPGEARP